ncbi:MAG TPA: hypothetical protein VG053_06380 [Solirubrobacteraceae bacterium]|jgi:hypothetical protein|nr:hypothetical protein [Solirubrobacteraceae bacterium]
METVEPEPRLYRLQSTLQCLHKVGLLDKLPRWMDGEQGGDGVSKNRSSGSPRRQQSVVSNAMERAKAMDAQSAAYEPGSRIGRLLPSVIASPARSQDPRLASPDWRLLAPPESNEYQDAIANPKTTLDSDTDQEVISLINALAPRREEGDY